MKPSDQNLPQGIYDLLDRIDPDGNRVGYDRHSDGAYTLYVFKLDDSIAFWRASLSLDGRWTLSPIY